MNVWRWALVLVAAVGSVSADDFDRVLSRDVARTVTLDMRVLAEPTGADYRAAYLMLGLAQELDPENIELTRRMIEAAWAAGDEAAVISQTRRLVKLDPEDTVALLRVISWKINKLQTAEARLEAYDRFLGEAGAKIDPSIRSRLALDSAMLLREVGDLDGFTARLAFALRLDQTNKEAASLALTFFADRVDDPIGRLDLMTQLLLSDPLDPNVHHQISLELASNGAFWGAARYHTYVRAVTTAGGIEMPELLQHEMMCLNWLVNGPQAVLDPLQGQLDTERFYSQEMLKAAIENDTDLPDDFVMPEDVRLESSLLAMRLYAADAAGDQELRARALQDLTVGLREQIDDISDPQKYQDVDPTERARVVFAMRYDIFRAYAMFGDDPGLVELAADDLRRFSGEQSTIWADLDGWVALRNGDGVTAAAYFETAPPNELVSLIGLALSYELLDRPADAVRALQRVHRLTPLGVQGAWAISRANALMPENAEGMWPWAPRMERFVAQTPRWIEEMLVDTTSFMSLEAVPVDYSTSALGATPIRITLRNLAPVPLGVGPDRPINSSFMLSPRTEIDVKAQIELAQPEVIEMGRRLRLLPREKLTIELDPKMGFTGWVLETNSYRTIRTRWRAVQGFMIGQSGYFVPGPNCLTTATGPLLETLNSDALRPIGELAMRVQTVPRDELRAALVAVRTRLMVADSNAEELTALDRATLASACADRFAQADVSEKLLMLTTLPHAGQADEMREVDELARRDSDARVLAMTILTRMPEVDAALLERARSLDEPWLTEVAGVVEARTAAGRLGYAHATPAVNSLGGYLRGSGTLDSPEFDLPETNEPPAEDAEP